MGVTKGILGVYTITHLEPMEASKTRGPNTRADFHKVLGRPFTPNP